MKPASQPSPNTTPHSANRKAFRDYHVLEKIEAGIVLTGAEVKSIRAGGVSLTESHARVDNREAFLINLYIPPYKHAGPGFSEDPRRPRKLLLHRKEIEKLAASSSQKGKTLVPLNLYFKAGKVKLELAIAQGKLHEDRREDLKKKTADREAARAMSIRQKR